MFSLLLLVSKTYTLRVTIPIISWPLLRDLCYLPRHAPLLGEVEKKNVVDSALRILLRCHPTYQISFIYFVSAILSFLMLLYISVLGGFIIDIEEME